MNEWHEGAPAADVVSPEAKDTVARPEGELNEELQPQTSEAAAAPPEAGETHAGVNGVNGTGRWRVEAGRKGARRVHELIRAGRLYEQEHGLTSGRQRLRQLIDLGRRYEQEHGGAAPAKPRAARLSQAGRDEVIETLVLCLQRLAKPSFRAELARLAEALRREDGGRAA